MASGVGACVSNLVMYFVLLGDFNMLANYFGYSHDDLEQYAAARHDIIRHRNFMSKSELRLFIFFKYNNLIRNNLLTQALIKQV
jgi:hypothetical protein